MIYEGTPSQVFDQIMKNFVEAMTREPTEMPERHYHVDELLEQGEVWQSGDREILRIVDIEDDHLVNLKAFLLKHAFRYQSAVLQSMFHFAAGLGGEMAQDAMESEINQVTDKHALIWMEERPLYRAVQNEIFRRQGYSICRIIEQE
jgi:hypothetical protein